MNKLFLGGMITFLLIFPLITATQEIGPFTQYDCVDLFQICANCTYVNISSVVMPNSTQTYTNIEMTRDGTRYNSTFCTTDATGQYIANGVSDPDGTRTIFSYSFIINPSGVEQGSIFENPILLIFLLLAIAFLTLGVIFKLAPLGYLSGIMFTLGGIYTMIYGFNNSADLYTRGLAISLISVGVLIFLVAAWESLGD